MEAVSCAIPLRGTMLKTHDVMFVCAFLMQFLKGPNDVPISLLHLVVFEFANAVGDYKLTLTRRSSDSPALKAGGARNLRANMSYRPPIVTAFLMPGTAPNLSGTVPFGLETHSQANGPGAGQDSDLSF